MRFIEEELKLRVCSAEHSGDVSRLISSGVFLFRDNIPGLALAVQARRRLALIILGWRMMAWRF